MGIYDLSVWSGEEKAADKKLILWYQPVKTSDKSVIRNHYKHYKIFLAGPP
ncbi:MAG: hypothetical protein GXO71_07285 [Caldiserica bacterium]|nr:hypothetical protein [Caldisericota bacterium]